MPLAAGTRIGPYEIVSLLGTGGMGEVYKARDSRLGRSVAVKVLRGDVGAKASRHQRFVQEAQAASALNHPNIVTVYDVVEHDGADCLVMEYIAGKTLDALIPRHGMRLNEALRIAVQVTDGLRKAHAAGIIHRDIKPSNIMVPDDGPVKILDFGLAKLTETGQTSEDDTTRSVRAETEEGTVMGTVAYMSPEQAEGRKLDARTDIFSFGALLYEMLTGRRAFTGESKMSTISAILKEEPKPVENIPADLEKILRRCLRKDRDQRSQHMDDLRVALEEVREDSESGRQGATSAKPARSGIWPWAVAGGLAAILTVATTGYWWFGRKQEVAAEPLRLRRVTSDAGLSTTPALSPDGKLLAYSTDRATGGEHLDIWLQHLGSGEPVRLTNGEGDEIDPDFSPDGSRIAYGSTAGGIFVIPVLGGEPSLLVPRGSRPRFSPDGKWLAYHVATAGAASGTSQREAWVIPVAGGSPRRIAAGFYDVDAPLWSPDSSRLLMKGNQKSFDPPDWWLAPLGVGEVAPIGIAPLLIAAKLPSKPGVWIGDWLIFTGLGQNSANLWRVRLDVGSGKVHGKLERITSGTAREQFPAIAADGSLALASSQLSSDLWMLPADTNQARITGPLERLTEDPADDTEAAISLDGTKVAFLSNRDGGLALWLRDTATGKLRKIANTFGRWIQITADGRKVGFPGRDGQKQTYAVLDLTDNSRREFELQTRTTPWGMSPLGSYVFPGTDGIGRTQSIIRVESGESKEVFMKPKNPLLSLRFSPNEQWIAFHTRNSELTRQIWVAPFQYGRVTPESEWIPITEGKALDRDPSWSPDGNLLYWLADRGGTRGIWACKLDPVTKRPAGAPFEVRMFRGTRRSMMPFENTGLARLAVARDKIVFALGEATGNIWMTRLPLKP